MSTYIYIYIYIINKCNPYVFIPIKFKQFYTRACDVFFFNVVMKFRACYVFKPHLRVLEFYFFSVIVIFRNGPKSDLSARSEAESSGRCSGNYTKVWLFKCSVFTTLLTSHINHRALKLYLFVAVFAVYFYGSDE